MTPTPRILLVGPGGPPTLSAHMRAAGLEVLLRESFDTGCEIVLAWGGPSASREGFQQITSTYSEPIKLWRLISSADIVVLFDVEAMVNGRNSVELTRLRFVQAVARQLRKKTMLVLPPGISPSDKDKAATRALIDRADFVISTGPSCHEALQRLGIRRHVELACDPAFAIKLSYKKRATRQKFQERRVIGLAPVDESGYPVRGALWGPEALRAHWPAHHTWDAQRAHRSIELEVGYADFVAQLVRAKGLAVKLFATCAQTEATCLRILEKLAPEIRYHTQLCVSTSVDGLMATELLEVDHLITSNYAVAVLGMATGRPMAGLCGDRNLEAALADCALRDSLVEQQEENSTLLQLERLFHALTFDNASDKEALAEYLLETLPDACTHLSTAIVEWRGQPEVFRQ